MYRCGACGKTWTHPVTKCIFCGGEVRKEETDTFTVVGFTEVCIPSIGNEDVPYFVLLLEDVGGNRILQKTFDRYDIGDRYQAGKGPVKSHVYGVIGTGMLGLQICEFLITQGYRTIVKTRGEYGEKKTRKKLEARLERTYDSGAATAFLSRLVITTQFSDLSGCDVIIEAAPENMAMKEEIFRTLSVVCDKKTIFATNSSSLSINALAAVTDRPARFLGIHFFNPVRRMDLVEVVMGEKTTADTRDRIVADLEVMGKKPVVVHDSPGYVVNRLLLPQINEAILLFESGIASKEDIDKAVKLGLNHPMGPFQLADYIGLDICLSILEVLHNDSRTGTKKPAALLYRLCSEGKLGVKTKEGFYKY